MSRCPLCLLRPATRSPIGLSACKPGASSLGAALIPLLVGLAMGLDARRIRPAIALLCLLTGCRHALIRIRRHARS